jgi:hypothetical protein
VWLVWERETNPKNKIKTTWHTWEITHIPTVIIMVLEKILFHRGALVQL